MGKTVGVKGLNSGRLTCVDVDTAKAIASGETDDKLAKEVDGLREHAHSWRGENDSETRRVRLGTRALVQIVGGML